MKKRSVLHQLAIFFVAAGTFLSIATFAQANTLTLPKSYTYAGLIFADPLTFNKPLSIPQPTTAITFSAKHKLLINRNDTKKPLESIVLTPTVDEAETMTTDEVTEPTPTVFVQEADAPTPTIAVPTATPTVAPTTAPTTASFTPQAQSNPGGLNADDIFGMVNAYRTSQGLPAFQQDAKTCSLAATRAPMVAGEVASGTMHAGLVAMDLRYWNTENIISMNSDQAAFNWWINDPIHHDAIVSHNIYSCVACSGNSCAEEFTSYQPK
ncbi:MAG TPA: hypothetical protein VLF93_01140 [Candidatus Saccharimonadales bacterium]|nr:hypothetical protein [Candidatus Saccharimonadales bacterium]